MATDRLSLAQALEEGGIARAAAERISTEIFDAIHDNVATKADLQRVEAGLKADVAALGARLDLVEHRLLTRLGGLLAVATGILIAIKNFG